MISRERFKTLFYRKFIQSAFDFWENEFIQSLTCIDNNVSFYIKCQFMQVRKLLYSSQVNTLSNSKTIENLEKESVIDWFFSYLYEEYQKYSQYPYLVPIDHHQDDYDQDLKTWLETNKHELRELCWFIHNDNLHVSDIMDGIWFKNENELAFFRLANSEYDYIKVNWT